MDISSAARNYIGNMTQVSMECVSRHPLAQEQHKAQNSHTVPPHKEFRAGEALCPLYWPPQTVLVEHVDTHLGL